MIRSLALSFIVLLLCTASAPAQPQRGSDSKAEFIAKYRMGDEADEKARLEQAKAYKLDFATPELAFKSWQATIVRGNKQEYLDCLHPEFRAKEYPDGVRHYIKNVDYLKYWYLTMYAALESSKIEGDTAQIVVVFAIRREDGQKREDRNTFQLKRHEKKWLFMSR